MTKEQELMLVELMKQNDAVLEMNWQILQALVPLQMVEDDDVDDDEPTRTLQ